MKRKILMGIVAGAILFGGALGVGALVDDGEKVVQNQTAPIVNNSENANEKINSDDRYNNKRGSDDQGYDDQYGDNSMQNVSKEVKITEDEAVAIATKDTPGDVIEVELDDYRYYEIEVKNGQYEVEYKIDANTGAILEKDIDRDDD